MDDGEAISCSSSAVNNADQSLQYAFLHAIMVCNAVNVLSPAYDFYGYGHNAFNISLSLSASCDEMANTVGPK